MDDRDDVKRLAMPPARVVEKPWGREEWLAVGDRIVMKRIVVRDGFRLSLQLHRVKEEAWLIVRGRARVVVGESEGVMLPGDVLHLRPNTIHRVAAAGEDVEIIEASTPELDDVVRLDDDYGRSGT